MNVRRSVFLAACLASVTLPLACSSADATSADPANVIAGKTVNVRLLAINDFHGNLQPPAGSSGMVTAKIDDPVGAGTAQADGTTKLVPAGGAAFLATHVKRLREGSDDGLMVSAGDLTGATPLVSALFHDEPSVLVMNSIGLDLTSVGNHEFDHGLGELRRLQGGGCHPTEGCAPGITSFPGASYEYLAANVHEATGEVVFPKYAIREFGKVKIAFIGMTLEGTPAVSTPKGVEGLSFGDEVETVAAVIPEIKAQGVSAIVVLVHEGALPAKGSTYDECNVTNGPLFDIANALDPAVDVIVSGHTHQAYNCPDLGGKLVTSAASYGRIVTSIDLEIDPFARKVVHKSAHNVPVTRDVEPDADVTGIVATYESLSGPLANGVVGHVGAPLTKEPNAAGESPLGDVIADAQLAATKADGHAEIAFMNPGGIRADVTFAPTGAEAEGEVTYGELFTTQPFSNGLVTISLTGAQIEAALEQQWGADGHTTMLQVSNGFSYTYDATKAAGDRIDPANIFLDGAPLDPARTYRVTCNAFLAMGGDGFTALKAGGDWVGGPIDLEALVAWFKANDPVPTPSVDRITRR